MLGMSPSNFALRRAPRLLVTRPMPSTPESLQKFVSYCQQHLTGDEKGESQTFLDRFFQAFGHEGVKGLILTDFVLDLSNPVRT
jgi:hypothetical protein